MKINDKTLEIMALWGNRIAGIWTFAIGAMVLWRVSDHAMWRDELQAWAIVRDSVNLDDFLFNMGYEGFPFLWHGMLGALQIFTSNPDAMQALHVLFALGNLFLIWRYMPAPWYVRALLVAAYPLSYQYALFSRCYAPGLFFILAGLAARERGKNFLSWVLLGVGSQTTILETCVASMLAFHRFLVDPKIVKKEARGIAVFTLLVAIAVYTAFPSAERVGVQGPMGTDRFMMFLYNFVISFHTGLVYGIQTIPDMVETLVAVGIFCGLCLKGAWRSVLAYAVLVVVFMGINQYGYGLIPYHVMLLPVGLACLVWQAQSMKSRWAQGGFVLLFACMACAGVERIAVAPDVPYSQSKNVAAWIDQRGLRDAFWVAVPDWAGTPVAVYLNRKFYYPQCKCEMTAPHWAKNAVEVMPVKDVVVLAHDAMKARNLNEGWLLLGSSWEPQEYQINSLPDMYVEQVRLFVGAEMASEQYVVYRLTMKP